MTAFLCGSLRISAFSALKRQLNAEGAEIRRGPQRRFPSLCDPRLACLRGLKASFRHNTQCQCRGHTKICYSRLLTGCLVWLSVSQMWINMWRASIPR